MDKTGRRQVGARWAVVVLGGALLVALVVTMVRISGPSPGSSGLSGEKSRQARLSREAERILTALGSGPAGTEKVLEGESLRYGGEVLRVRVGPGWATLSPLAQGRLLDDLFARYTKSWQAVMHTHSEPAVSLRSGDRRVALHTSMDRWVRPSGDALAPGSSK